MKKMLFGFIATVVFSVSGFTQISRSNFVNGKTQEQIVNDFNKLSAADKNLLWIDKLNQLLSQNLPTEHTSLITELKQLLLNNSTRSNQGQIFIQKSVRLAQITPSEDLINMFESLLDYRYQGRFVGATATPEALIKDIENLSVGGTNNSSQSRACSCRWCLFTAGATTNCKATIDGCGWFGLQSCTHCLSCH